MIFSKIAIQTGFEHFVETQSIGPIFILTFELCNRMKDYEELLSKHQYLIERYYLLEDNLHSINQENLSCIRTVQEIEFKKNLIDEELKVISKLIMYKHSRLIQKTS